MTLRYIASLAGVVAALAAATSCSNIDSPTATLDTRSYAATVARDSAGRTTGYEAMAAHMATAVLAPDIAKRRLRSCLDGDLISDSGQWPVSTDRLMWALAAWEVYLADGDIDWLIESHNAIRNTLAADLEVKYDPHTGLMRGQWLDLMPPKHPQSAESPTAVAEQMSLTANVVAARTASILSRMEQEVARRRQLSLPPTANIPAGLAETITESVNNLMWSPSQGRYSAGLYASTDPCQLPDIDPLVESLAIITRLANSDMARSIVERTPSGAAIGADQHPLTRAYWAWGANIARNTQAVHQALRTIPPAINDSTDPTDAIAAASLMLRGLAGARLTPDGITFAPIVPRQLSGTIEIDAIPYRGCSIHLTINGTGAKIDSWSINGQSGKGSPRVDASATGPIRLVINMANDHTDRPTVDNASQPPSQAETFAPIHTPATQTPTIYETPLTDSDPYRFVTDSIAGGTYLLRAQSVAQRHAPPAAGAVIVDGQVQGYIVLTPSQLHPTAESTGIFVKLCDGSNRLEIIGYHNSQQPASQLSDYTITRLQLTRID